MTALIVLSVCIPLSVCKMSQYVCIPLSVAHTSEGPAGQRTAKGKRSADKRTRDRGIGKDRARTAGAREGGNIRQKPLVGATDDDVPSF